MGKKSFFDSLPCPLCKERVDIFAVKCPYCHTYLKEDLGFKVDEVGFIIAAIIATIIGIAGNGWGGGIVTFIILIVVVHAIATFIRYWWVTPESVVEKAVEDITYKVSKNNDTNSIKVVCGNCGLSNLYSESNKKCKECGTYLYQFLKQSNNQKNVSNQSKNNTIFCKKCGKKISQESVFCSHCGQNVTKELPPIT